MKKTLYFLTLAFCLWISSNAFAQTPNGIPYQAVARNSSGNLLVNQNVRVRFSIHDVTATGSIVYQESQTITTNELGLFTVNIGQGIVSDGAGGIGNSGGGIAGTTSGAFASVNWGTGLKFTQVEIDVTGGTNYVDMGTQQMMSVPYALYAANANVPGVPGPQGPAGNDGETGPQGADGAQGPEGPTGLLSAAAAAGNTPYWNGSSWVINSSNLFNNGGNIGIGTAAPNTSAALDINSTSGSLLIPRMTTTQRNILTAAEGMVIYNTTDMKFQGCINVNTPSSTSVDQAQLNFNNAAGTNDQSQSFTAGITGELTSARVLLNIAGPPQTATVFIRSGLGNAGAILYQTTVTVNSTSSGAWYTINPTGVSVTAGGTYTINIIQNGGGDFLDRIEWRNDHDNPYAGGSFYIWGMEPTSWDAAFETTVSTPSTDILQWVNLNAAESVSGPAGETGPQGADGAQGPEGPTGLLSAAAAAGNTPYWNGSSWVINSSNLFNNGGNIGIGTAAPNTSAALDINSTSGSLLIPRMTTTQRNILTETEGMVIYNTTDMKFQGCINVNTPSSTSVDQAQLNYDNGGVTNDQSQSFTAGITGELTSARVLLNCPGGPQTATVFIRSGLGNAGAILYQTTVTVNYQDGGAWYTINPIGVSVSAGGTYTINIINNGGGGSLSRIDWLVDQGNPYAGGIFYNLGMEPTSWDAAFETTVSTPSTDILQWVNLNAAESVSGPAGNDGATGSQGPAGNDGATGANGNNGQSAYQVWLNLGNSGTEAVFIASLTGPQGPAGNDGAVGATGPTGPQGAQGATGAAGQGGGVIQAGLGILVIGNGTSIDPYTVSSKIYTIGLWPELGGYVFRISADGRHGLVAETQNQSFNVAWFTAQDAISNPLNHSTNGQKFMDWRLPTKYELNEMYLQNSAIGGFSGLSYWSSTEANSTDAYYLNMGGFIDYQYKYNGAQSRAVRAF